MPRARDFLLDTNILLHYARKSDVYIEIERQFHLQASPFSPFVCVVTLGEIRALAMRKQWGEAKLRRLDELLAQLVMIDISSPEVIHAYARILAAALENGWGIHNKKNDLWIAAVAQVTGCTLLTTDSDFDPLEGVFLHRIRLDAHTGAVISS